MKEIERRDYKTRIIKYLTDESPQPLSSEEEMVLARWEHVDHLMRQHVEWTDIILKHTLKFSISKFTAEHDISAAQEVFGRSRRINKKYVVHLHLQRVEKFIDFLEKKFYQDDFGMPDAKDIAAMAKLYEAHTYALNSMPAEIIKKNLPPPIMIFNLVAGKQVIAPMSVDDAINAADDFITDAEEIIPDDE